jgi:hypothetical protein
MDDKQEQKQFIIVLVSPSGGQVPLSDCLPTPFNTWQIRLVEQQPPGQQVTGNPVQKVVPVIEGD